MDQYPFVRPSISSFVCSSFTNATTHNCFISFFSWSQTFLSQSQTQKRLFEIIIFTFLFHGFPYWGRMGQVVCIKCRSCILKRQYFRNLIVIPPPFENLSIQKNPPCRLPPAHQITIFESQPNKTSLFSCSHYSCPIFVLILYSGQLGLVNFDFN